LTAAAEIDAQAILAIPIMIALIHRAGR